MTTVAAGTEASVSAEAVTADVGLSVAPRGLSTPSKDSSVRPQGSLVTAVLIGLRAGHSMADIARAQGVDRALVEAAARQLVRLGLAQASGPGLLGVSTTGGAGCSECPSIDGGHKPKSLPLACAGCMLARR